MIVNRWHVPNPLTLTHARIQCTRSNTENEIAHVCVPASIGRRSSAQVPSSRSASFQIVTDRVSCFVNPIARDRPALRLKTFPLQYSCFESSFAVGKLPVNG